MLGICCTEDRSRRACRFQTDFFSISAVDIPDTHQWYLSISSGFYTSSATKLLPGFNSIMGSSFTSSLVSDGGLQTEVSLKPRLWAVLATLTEVHLTCSLAHGGNQCLVSPTGTLSLLTLWYFHLVDFWGPATQGILQTQCHDWIFLWWCKEQLGLVSCSC